MGRLMLLSTPGLARYFLHRALMSDDVRWQKWLQKHQQELLKIDSKQGLIVQWLKWNADSSMIERLVSAGCRIQKTSKHTDAWTYLVQQIRENYKQQATTYSAPDQLLVPFVYFFEQLKTLSKICPDAQGLNMLSKTLLFQLERKALLGEKAFQHIKLIKRYASILLLQINQIGPKEAMICAPSLNQHLKQSIEVFHSSSFRDSFEAYQTYPDYASLQEIFTDFQIFQTRYALENTIPTVPSNSGLDFDSDLNMPESNSSSKTLTEKVKRRL